MEQSGQLGFDDERIRIIREQGLHDAIALIGLVIATRPDLVAEMAEYSDTTFNEMHKRLTLASLVIDQAFLPLTGTANTDPIRMRAVASGPIEYSDLDGSLPPVPREIPSTPPPIKKEGSPEPRPTPSDDDSAQNFG